MKSMRPKLLASSCAVVALLLPSVALSAEPAAAPPAKAAAPEVAKPQPASPSAGSPQPAAAPAAPAADPAPPPSPEVLLEAKQRFDRGFELYEEGEYPLALIEFNRAYELVPNYRVLYNIGQVCIQLGQYANARRALEEYLQKGGDALAADRRAAVNKDLEMLGHRTAFLTIGANLEGAEVLVDDLVVGKTPLGPALLVDAGVHRVTVRLPGYLPKVSNITLAGGDAQTLTVALERQPEEKQTIVVREREVVEDNATTWMIAGWVTTGALAAGAVVTGIMGAGEADELDQLRGGLASDYDGELPNRLDDARSNAKTLFLVSDVLTGAAVIVGGLSLWITLDPPSPSRPAETPAPEAKGVQVGYERGQVQLRGSF